ncbi:MAG: efflux RND transporter periplasmic adaptor subunit, partial [Pseudomonadota bacterium]
KFESTSSTLLRLEIPVPQYYFQATEVGTPVHIRFDALPDRDIEATISAVIPISDETSRTFRVRIDIPNEEGLLAPGMTAKATLSLAGKNQAPSLLAARDALVRKPNGDTTVWIITTEDGVNKVEEVNVTTGRSFRGGIELVDSELNEGIFTVIRGNEILRPGQTVRVASEVPPPY